MACLFDVKLLMNQNIHIGTSGWSYKHWKDIFYPPKLKSTEYLSFYARHFNITEINTSFYHLPKHETVLGWLSKVPAEFKFCPKISRFITHMKKLRDPDEPLELFFDVFEPMKTRMGPVLIQLPPSLRFNYDVSEYFFQLLKKKYKGYEFVLEVRHTTWLQEDSLTLFAKYDIGFVISQSGEVFPYSEMVTAKNIYVRFHGPGYLYASAYTDEMLSYYADKFINWVKEGHEIWAFFNNDVHGHAFRDAKRLEEMVKK
jgi:uncharacterized protein YecE (DUF72 family)